MPGSHITDYPGYKTTVPLVYNQFVTKIGRSFNKSFWIVLGS